MRPTPSAINVSKATPPTLPRHSAPRITTESQGKCKTATTSFPLTTVYAQSQRSPTIRRSRASNKEKQDKTTRVQDAIVMRKIIKKITKLEEQQKIEEKKQQQVEHYEQWLIEKEKRKLISPTTDLSPSNEDDNDSKTEISDNPQHATIQSKKSVVFESKKQLKESAKYLLTFAYDEDDNALEAFVKTFAFVYRYHLYNLSRRILYRPEDNHSSQAVKLRTQVVHVASKIFISIDTILNTQRLLKEFVTAEVSQLSQRHTFIWQGSNRDIREIAKMSGTSSDHLTFESMDTLPLSKMLYAKEIDDLSDTTANLSMTTLYTWMKHKAIPFIHFLNDQSNSMNNNHAHPNNNLTHNPYSDAMKFMIIILGEYCTLEISNRMQQEFETLEPGKEISVTQLRNFLKSGRDARNALAHNIFQIDADDLLIFLQESKAISDEKLILVDEKFDTFLSPHAYESETKKPDKDHPQTPRLSQVSGLFGQDKQMESPPPPETQADKPSKSIKHTGSSE